MTIMMILDWSTFIWVPALLFALYRWCISHPSKKWQRGYKA